MARRQSRPLLRFSLLPFPPQPKLCDYLLPSKFKRLKGAPNLHRVLQGAAVSMDIAGSARTSVVMTASTLVTLWQSAEVGPPNTIDGRRLSESFRVGA